jgi:hypothetical protein
MHTAVFSECVFFHIHFSADPDFGNHEHGGQLSGGTDAGISDDFVFDALFLDLCDSHVGHNVRASDISSDVKR